MTIPPPTSAIANVNAKADIVKTTRQQVFDRLRNDWAFDPRDVSSHAEGSAGVDAVESVSDSSCLEGVDLVNENDVTEWRERTYASSDPSSDEDQKPLAFSRKVKVITTNVNGNSKKSACNDENASEALRKQARKRRRRERLHEELEWNEGLRFWEARRDAWCCARRVSASGSVSGSGSGTSANDSPKPPTSSGSTSPTTSSSTSTTPATSHDTLTLLPLAPPLLPPTDPTRAIISPSYYPSIFNKVVTQSLTPSIPINLSHMVPALVQGWKTNGDWPPKGTVMVPPGATMTSAAQDAVKRENGGGGLGIDRKISGAKDRLLKKYHQRHGQKDEGNGNTDESSSPVSVTGKGVGMLKGVAKVGKVFRFSFSGGGDEKG